MRNSPSIFIRERPQKNKKNHSMRMLFLTTHAYIPQMTGGSENSTHDLCISLKNLGFSVGVLSGLEKTGSVYVKNRIKSRIFSRNFPIDKNLGYPVYRGWDPVGGITDVINDFMPDVAVIQAGIQSEFLRNLVSIGVPTIVYVRDVEFEQQIRAVGNREILTRLFGKATIISNSNFTASKFKMVFGITSHVVPPLVQWGQYKVTAHMPRRYVLFVNPVRVKGVDIAFAIAKRRPDIPFIFLEGWPLGQDRFSQLKKKGESLGNVAVVRRTSDMRTYYGQARILMVPSIWEEAWGRVITEAQINGIPVLASNRGGLPESVGQGGILVDPSADIEKWVEALSRLWDDQTTDKTFSKLALNHANRIEIQPQPIVERFIEIAKSTIARKHA